MTHNTQVTRKTRDLHTNRWQAVTVHAITSLPFDQARPARLADLLRGHRAIEVLPTCAMSPSPIMPSSGLCRCGGREPCQGR